MHNRFESLLHRYKLRRRKIIAKRIAAISLLALFGGGAAYLTWYDGAFLNGGWKGQSSETSSVTTVQSTAESVRAKPALKEVHPKTEAAAEPKRQIEKKSSATVLKEKKIALQKSEKSEPKEIKKEVIKEVVKPEAKANKDEQAALLKPEVEKKEAKPKVMLEVREVTDIDALLEQYANSPRYSVALKIARKYYDEGDFENASLWARKANILDRDDERAWIIYAQSEYALGREERAKRILRLFLDYKDSAKARSLLMTWGRE